MELTTKQIEEGRNCFWNSAPPFLVFVMVNLRIRCLWLKFPSAVLQAARHENALVFKRNSGEE